MFTYQEQVLLYEPSTVPSVEHHLVDGAFFNADAILDEEVHDSIWLLFIKETSSDSSYKQLLLRSRTISGVA